MVRQYHLCVVPAKAGTHTPRILKWKMEPASRRNNNCRWLWVPAFAGTTRGGSLRELHRRRGHAAVEDDGLAGHEARGVGAEIGDRAGDFVGLADPPQWRGGAAVLEAFFVFPQRAGEIGFDQAGRHAIDAHALRAPFAGEAAA